MKKFGKIKKIVEEYETDKLASRDLTSSLGGSGFKS